MNGDLHSVVIVPGSLYTKGEKPGLNGPVAIVPHMLEISQDSEESEMFIEKEVEDSVEYKSYPHGACSRWVEKVEILLENFYRRHKVGITLGMKIIAFLIYIAYFSYCVSQRYYDQGSYIMTALTVFLVLKIAMSRFCGPKFRNHFQSFLVWYGTSPRARCLRKCLRYGLYMIALGGLLTYLGFNLATNYSSSNGQAVLGMFALILICYVTSYKPSRVNWHPVFWGFIIQFAFAALTLRTETGYQVFKWIGDIIYKLVRLSDSGSTFILGASFLVDNAGFLFECSGVMIFFNSCIFLLEYYGILEFIVLKIGRGLALCLETRPVESVVAAANIFIGVSEAPLLVRPYLSSVTRSEIHAIMTCSFSSISGAFMAMFIKVGAPPSHLLTAAVISAPAALAITKLLYPEVDVVNCADQKNIKMRDDSKHRNALQAFTDGALFSVKLVAAIMVNILAFVSMLSLMNTVLTWLGERANVPDMTFQRLCSYIFYPLSFMMGADPDDCGKIGSLIGIKLTATPFVAYAGLGQMIRNRQTLEDYVSTTNGTWHWEGGDIILDATNMTLPYGIMKARSEVITTYALCGMSAFPAIGFTLGSLIPLAPERKGDIVGVVLRAFIAGNLANIITGSVAGVMYSGT